MVKFRTTMGGYEVRVDGQPFGHIDKDGFFTDSTVIKDFMRVSSDDLRKIADKAAEHQLAVIIGHHESCSAPSRLLDKEYINSRELF